jgi:hypothetical protein
MKEGRNRNERGYDWLRSGRAVRGRRGKQSHTGGFVEEKEKKNLKEELLSRLKKEEEDNRQQHSFCVSLIRVKEREEAMGYLYSVERV